MYHINEERFLNDLHRLEGIGLLPDKEGGGRDRRAFSAAERASRSLFVTLAESAELTVTSDAAGNLSARMESKQPNARTLLFGSHFDTVPNGGPYDGALGVVAGIETLRVLRETHANLPLKLECIAFTDEEGRYCGLTGSQLYVGTYSREATQRFYDAAMTYPDDVAAMRNFLPTDFTVDNLMAVARPADEIVAFVELHIEQGPQLEHHSKTIGIVDAIFGRASCQVVFHGRSDHAGTTPMTLRADALVAGSRFIAHMHDFVRDECPGAVLTCGDARVAPGADNVVPREARVLVEYRANSSRTLERIGHEVDAAIDSVNLDDTAVSAVAEGKHRLEPVPMDAKIQQAVTESCEGLAYAHMPISSGALHDAHSLAAIVPAGMIFVPSIGGRSHCPQEDTHTSDLIAGANVLLNTIARLSNIRDA